MGMPRVVSAVSNDTCQLWDDVSRHGGGGGDAPGMLHSKQRAHRPAQDRKDRIGEALSLAAASRGEPGAAAAGSATHPPRRARARPPAPVSLFKYFDVIKI